MTDALEKTWTRIHTWLAANAPLVLESLQPPATDEQLRNAESSMGVVLPDEVRTCYRVHDGQQAVTMPPNWPVRQAVPGFLYGEQWLSLDMIVEHWRIKKKLLEEGAFRRRGEPHGPIYPVWWHPLWLPLTTDPYGYMKCLDLIPSGQGGRVGQVIYWCNDVPERGSGRPRVRRLADTVCRCAGARRVHYGTGQVWTRLSQRRCTVSSGASDAHAKLFG